MYARAFCKLGLICLIVSSIAISTRYVDAEDASSTKAISATSTTYNETSTTPAFQASQTPTQVHKATQVEVKAQVETLFSDIPVMSAIAKCESNFRQFTDSGNVLHGGAGTMIGVFQFDEDVHASNALALGYNINTVEGNLGYARYLYTKQGTDPWVSSLSCWKNYSNSFIATSSGSQTNLSTLNIDLSFGTTHPQVIFLQKLLNDAGFPVASSGPGSPGFETTKFGSLTRAAVKKFQCARSIICSGDEYSTGYGYVDERTRSALEEGSNNPVIIPMSNSIVTNSNSSSTQQPVFPSASSDVEALQAQIVSLLKIVAQLQSQIALLAQR